MLLVAACGDPQPSRIGVQRFDRLESDDTLLEPIELSAKPTLLDNYRQRPPQSREQWEAEARDWVLPQKTKRLDAVLFIGISQADMAAIETVLEQLPK